jgi:hypothetical protein
MNKHFLLFLAGAAAILCLAWSSVSAGDMKAEVTADVKLFHSHFGQTPLPNKAITIDPQGVHFSLSAETEKAEYTTLYSFFKLGGDFEISANYDWTPVPIPKKGYGVSCGIQFETNDKKKSVALARGNFPGKGSSYRVSIGTMNADKKTEYKVQPPFATQAKSGRLILARKKNEIICSAVDEAEEPRELCRIPFTDAAVQRVLIFADSGTAPADLDVWITQVKIRADEMSHHMVKQEKLSGWWGVIAGAALIVVGTTGFLVVRRLRTGRWGGRDIF